MSENEVKVAVRRAPWLSLDAWAVVVALAAAALIRFGVLPRVPW
jgi:hypothetical protein